MHLAVNVRAHFVRVPHHPYVWLILFRVFTEHFHVLPHPAHRGCLADLDIVELAQMVSYLAERQPFEEQINRCQNYLAVVPHAIESLVYDESVTAWNTLEPLNLAALRVPCAVPLHMLRTA